MTASGLLVDLEPSRATWRLSEAGRSSAASEKGGEGSRRFLAQPPAGERNAVRIRLLGGETFQRGARGGPPFLWHSMTSVAPVSRCPPECVFPCSGLTW